MTSTRITTAAELLAMGSAAPFELFQGKLIEVSPSIINSNLILNYINWRLFGFAREHGLGYVSVARAGDLVETNPDPVVAPGIAFVASHRMPNNVPERGYLAIC